MNLSADLGAKVALVTGASSGIGRGVAIFGLVALERLDQRISIGGMASNWSGQYANGGHKNP